MTFGQTDANLRRFYAEARSSKQQEYSKSTLLGFRYSMERYLNAPPLSKQIKISTDPRFKRSNEMLNAKITSRKRSGKENVVHKPYIEDEDLQKLKSSGVLSLSNPLSLLRNVWFHVVLFFCRRGREGQRALTTSSFKFETDAAGRRYVTMAHDEASKNHPGGLNDTSSHEKDARIYENDQEKDGYTALSLYLSKVNPNCSAFFQYPKKNWRQEDASWYEERPMGVNALANMMKTISKEALLSKVYTNHSVRATAITLWSNAGIPNRHIMAISGHRNEQSLGHYKSRPSVNQLHNCSEVLSNALSSSTSCQPQNNVTQSQVLVSTPQHNFASIFGNCTIQNVQIVNQYPSQ